MSKRIYSILVILALLPIVVIVGSVGMSEFHRRNIQNAYDTIQVGDSGQRVLEVMGPPSSTEPCFEQPNCTSIYYYALFERWIVYVDSTDKVIDKVNNEGLF